MPARIATAVATAASVWCLESAHLLSPRAAGIAVMLLLIAEAVASSWPVPARRIAFPLSLATFGIAAFARVAATYSASDVSSARPLGAFLTAGAMVVLALAGARRRDLFARLGLLMAATGLALTAGASAAITPAVAVGLATGAAMVALERALLASARTAARSRRPPPALARTRLIAVPLAATAALTAYVASSADLPKHHPQTSVGNPTGTEAGSDDTSSAQTRLSPASGVMNLRVRGSLSNHAVARIEPFTADQGPQLWRAAVMDGYDGTRWYLADNPDPVTADGSEQVDQMTPIESNQLPLLTPGTALRLVTDDSAYDDPPFPQTVDGRYEVTSVVPDASRGHCQVPKAATRADEDNVARLRAGACHRAGPGIDCQRHDPPTSGRRSGVVPARPRDVQAGQPGAGQGRRRGRRFLVPLAYGLL